MADIQETIADIAAEKRRLAEHIRNNLSTVPVRQWDQQAEIKSLEDEANRLEAALRREADDAAKLREALEEIDKNTDLLDIAEDIAPKLHPSHSFVAVQIRKIVRAALAAPAPTKVKAYTALHRTRRDGPWYMSEFIYRDARQFDELRRRCAERCDREGDSYGAAMWRDAENIKIAPVEVELPDGIEIIDLDTTSIQPTKEDNP